MEWQTFVSLLIIFFSLVISAFFKLSVRVWTVLIGAVIAILFVTSYLPIALFLFITAIYLICAGFANLDELRQKYVTAPLLKKLKKQLPPISDTERMAIEAGDTWWEKELFCGNPDWKQLYYFPKPQLSQIETQFLANQVEKLCDMIDDWQLVYTERDLTPEIWNFLKQEKFFGMIIPKEYGGLGFSALAHSTVVTKISTRSVSVAVTTMVPNSLGPAELLMRYGTDYQKNYYLPKLAEGSEIPCFALTGPEAGSDAGSIQDKGIICYQELNGEKTLGIRLSWDKRYITLAPVATVLGLAFQLYDPEHLIGEVDHLGITLCLLPTSHPGVEIGNRHYPMHLAFMNGTTRGKDVFIPLDWIIGGKEMMGQGWKMLMECLSVGRSVSLPALATGSSKIAYRVTGAYSRIRRQFNVPIGEFEGIEEALGHIGGNMYLLEATRLMTVNAVDQGIHPSIVSAIAKYHMTEIARRSMEHAMDIHAGHMIQVGPRNILANIYNAVPISITVEGANILTRNLIIFGQGAIRCHPYILREIELISAENANVKELDKTLMQHIGFFISNFIRAFTYGLTGGVFIFAEIKHRKIKGLERQLKRMSAGLALFADASLMLLGGSLKRRERISARLGDILSQLYLASAALKYFHDHGCPQDEVNYVRWSLQRSLYHIQIAFDELADNFPQRWIGTILKFFIFPFGRAYAAPQDKLHKLIAASLMKPSALRDKLTDFCYLGKDEHDLIFQQELALIQIAEVEPFLKMIATAVKQGKIAKNLDFNQRVAKALELNLLSQNDTKRVIDFEHLRADIIKVNEFSFKLDQVIV